MILSAVLAATLAVTGPPALPISLPQSWHVAPVQDIAIARWSNFSTAALCLDQLTSGSSSNLDENACSVHRASETPVSREISTLCGMTTTAERYEGDAAGERIALTVRISRDALGNAFVLRRIEKGASSQSVEPIASACPTTWWSLQPPPGFRALESDAPTLLAIFKGPTKDHLLMFSFMPAESLIKTLGDMKASLRKQHRTLAATSFCGRAGYLFETSQREDLIDVGMDYDQTMAIVPGPRFVYVAAEIRNRGARADPSALAALKGMCADALPPITWPNPKGTP